MVLKFEYEVHEGFFNLYERRVDLECALELIKQIPYNLPKGRSEGSVVHEYLVEAFREYADFMDDGSEDQQIPCEVKKIGTDQIYRYDLADILLDRRPRPPLPSKTLELMQGAWEYMGQLRESQ